MTLLTRLIAQCVLPFTIVGLNAFAQSGVIHNWTLKDGSTVPGDFVSCGTSKVVVRSHGTNCLVKISDLSTNDWLYLYDCKTNQRQAQLNFEATQMQSAGAIELTGKLIENFPEKVNQQRGWMDCEFVELDNNYTSEDEDIYLGFVVIDKNNDWFAKCAVQKNILGPNFMADNNDQKHNPWVEYVTALKRRDKIRLFGTVSAPLGSYFRRFDVEKVEMVEPAADAEAVKKVRESLEESQWQSDLKR